MGVLAIDVRLLGPEDLQFLLRARTDVFDNEINPQLASAFLAHSDYRIVLAMDGEAVVGMASGLFYFHPDKPLEFFVNEVGVAESHQRQGIARTLMDVLLDAARARGVEYAWVATERDNAAAKRLYTALGAEEQAMAYYEFDLKKMPQA